MGECRYSRLFGVHIPDRLAGGEKKVTKFMLWVHRKGLFNVARLYANINIHGRVVEKYTDLQSACQHRHSLYGKGAIYFAAYGHAKCFQASVIIPSKRALRCRLNCIIQILSITATYSMTS